MLDKEKLFEKVILFYQSLPQDLLDNIISTLPINREDKRRIIKLKSTKKKLICLCHHSSEKSLPIQHTKPSCRTFPLSLKVLLTMK